MESSSRKRFRSRILGENSRTPKHTLCTFLLFYTVAELAMSIIGDSSKPVRGSS